MIAVVALTWFDAGSGSSWPSGSRRYAEESVVADSYQEAEQLALARFRERHPTADLIASYIVEWCL